MNRTSGHKLALVTSDLHYCTRTYTTKTIYLMKPRIQFLLYAKIRKSVYMYAINYFDHHIKTHYYYTERNVKITQIFGCSNKV